MTKFFEYQDSDQYLDMLSLEDKYTRTPTAWELSNTFSDNINIIKELETSLVEKVKHYKPLIAKNSLWKTFMKYDPVTKTINKNRRFIKYSENKNLPKEKQSVMITDEEIQQAKWTPITELYDFERKRYRNNYIQCSCPFHKDKNPSFAIYKNTNKFICFSCHEKGDSINFIMKINHLSFFEAVRSLLK